VASKNSLQLAVLSALIRQHGPIPCIHIAIIRTGTLRTERDFRQHFTTAFRCEASELCVADDEVTLELPNSKIPIHFAEPTTFRIPTEAALRRDKLCTLFLRLPWDRTPLSRPLTSEDAAIALRHIVADSHGLKIIPDNTDDISAITLEKDPETSSVNELRKKN